MTRRKIFAGVAAVVAATGIAVSIAGVSSAREDASDFTDNDVVSHSNEDPASTEAYWTTERMRSAKPAPMERPEGPAHLSGE